MVLTNFIKTFFVTLFLLQLGFLNAYAQDSESYSRVGLLIHGGYTLAGGNAGMQPFGSKFNSQTHLSYNYGGGLQFALTPFWSLETGYRYNGIKGNEVSDFETIMHTASLKNILNFNRIYQRSQISKVINPYGIFGAEYDFYNYESADEQLQGKELSFIGGMGVAFSITNAIDIFGQYEFKLSSNRIDNVNSGTFPFDQIGMTSAGIRINFGGKPLNHTPPVRGLSDMEYEDFLSIRDEPGTIQSDDIAQNEQIRVLKERLNEANESAEKHRVLINLLAERLNQLQAEIDSLDKTEELKAYSASLATNRTESSPGSGYYVQVFNGREYPNAEKVKNRFQTLLGAELENAGDVFVIENGTYYRVLIGDFPDLSGTREVLEIAQREIPDAFPLRIER